MKNKLQTLYLLQLLDTELDELRELRGDLPDTVRELEEKADNLQKKIDECDSALRVGVQERDRMEKESLDFIGKIEKYKSQQLEVKNNKEYDALTREIEIAESTIIAYEAEIEQFADEAVNSKAKKEILEKELAAMTEEFDEKKIELTEVLAVTAEEENDLAAQREDAMSKILSDDLDLYIRIREAKGKAVAPVKRGSCSGCYNVVPPQLILEIKKHEQLYICEHCGRILVSEEISKETKIR